MPSPITIQYDFGATVITKVLTDFFTKTVIGGCDLNCNYGDACGAATVISGTDITVTNVADPWQISAISNNKDGYS